LHSSAAPLGLDYFYMDPVQGFLWAVVLVGGSQPFWRSIFANPIMRFYGRISYSLYLFHAIVWNWLVAAENLTSADPFSAPIMIFLYFGVATLAAYLSHRFFETPTINFGKRVGRWLTGGGFAPQLPVIPAAAPAGFEHRKVDRFSGAGDPVVAIKQTASGIGISQPQKRPFRASQQR
jgi:peptidoglycan/LPS O-acetylase OafA/YrhL